MKRIAIFLFGASSYVVFLGTFAYLFLFLANLGVPRSVDRGPTSSLIAAITINLLLVAAFGLQHSVMARPAFKKWWTRFVPESAERSAYVMATNLVLVAMFAFWQPLPAIVWEVPGGPVRTVLTVLFVGGWGLVFLATVLLNHFELFGLRQVWLQLKGLPYSRLPFKTPLVYRFVRHPLYVGWITAFWAAPTMTAGHLLFASAMTGYILIAIYFEERNLVEAHGEDYVAYRRAVPMLIPIPGRCYDGDRGPQEVLAA